MLRVKVSPKFQVVIPKEIRESLHLLPGQQMQVVQYENRIEFIPERDVGELEGFLEGIDTTFTRDEDRV
jgi:AbrB family looped-hinge helix DNA binding protein